MRHYVLQNYSDVCQIQSFPEPAPKTSVAVIDSVYQPVDDFADICEVGYCCDLVNHSDENETTGHGGVVSSILMSFSRDIEYNFYRVVQPSGEILQRHLLKAMGKAHLEHDVDVMNLSLGYDHSHDGVKCDMPSEPCKVREAAKRASEDGITVVAASGNANDDDETGSDQTVCCPALLDEVISVGGMFVACTAQPQGATATPPMQQPQPTPPPLACWVSEGGEVPGAYVCTGLGCSMSPDSGCEDHQVIVEWGGNVENKAGDVDVLAPTEFPGKGDSGEPRISAGTSYAVPMVTAVVSEAIEMLKYGHVKPDPDQIRSVIHESSKEVQECEVGYLNGKGTLDLIADRNDIKSSTPSDSPISRKEFQDE